MSLPATARPPKDFKELDWQRENINAINRDKDPSAVQSAPAASCSGSKSNQQQSNAPRTIVLPYYPGGSEKVSRYVEVDTDAEYGATMAQLRIKKSKPIIPGWLIELKDHYLRGVMDIKSTLDDSSQEGVNIEDMVSSLCRIVNVDMDISVSENEIFDVLKKIPKSCQGSFSFPHFMYGVGSPQLAQSKGIFMLNERRFSKSLESRFREKGSCNCNGSDKDKNKSDQSGGDHKNFTYDDEEEEDDNDLDDKDTCYNAEDEDGNSKVDETGYSTREKVFFSGLLIFEMFETLKQVECLYNLPKIPESTESLLKRNKKRGFGIDDIGHKKFKQAAWDTPLPPLPKISPYLSSVPFVTSRWNITQPANPRLRLRRTTSRLQPLHLAIRPPRERNQRICITENQTRVRRALEYLAANGDCVALLPDVHFVIHLSDTAVDKLEVITTMNPEECEPQDDYQLNKHEDNRYIMANVRKLYSPYRLPPQITQLSNSITFTDGLQLREICTHLQNQHWASLSQLKLEFREYVWTRMRVEQIPNGRLRDSFIYAFVTYLPYVSHLPIEHTNPLAF